MTALPGYFPMYLDDRSGKLLLEIPRFSTEFLYVNTLPAGIGSNDIGLDRGQIGNSRIVRFERSGNKVLLVEPNYRYRALTSDEQERRAVEQSFAQSVIWGFTVEAEAPGRVLVDATNFFLRDAHHIPETLSREKQGSYRLDPSRSALYLARTRNFPKNTDVESTLTFGGDQPGAFVREVVPSPESITVREHHSFVELPDGNYRPRAFDPRSSYFGIAFADYASPISEPIEKRYIERHRLRKKDPTAAVSDPVQPIVYYLDPGTPEPIRTALLTGARWWNQAFEAAGYRNAFQVELLPADADPMDIRYNIIQWVHRSTRGWSYGATISDPRTGEIIKGQVTLGSLRARQDFLIAEGLIADYQPGKPIDPRMEQMVLARLRQLAAHEVGHTLGLSHNYAASSHDRASVLDYPPPVVQLNAQGQIDLSSAYASGIGEWDKVAIAYGYQDFAPGQDEHAGLDAIIRSSLSRGLMFISDVDARSPGGAHPQAHLWDSGANAVDELNRLMQVRAKALANFDQNKIRPGAPMSTLENVLVPIYLLHRYQMEAAVKSIGGLDYRYALRGDGQVVANILPAAEQRRALNAVLATLDPAALTLPERILRELPPPAHAYERTREDFHPRTGLTFDALAAAETAADLTLSLLLNPQRATRLVEYHARDAKLPGLDEVIARLLKATWKTARPAGLAGEVSRTVDSVALYRLMALSADESASPQARAIAFQSLSELRKWLSTTATEDSADRAHFAYGAQQIKRFTEDPHPMPLPAPVAPPDGSPIGSEPEF